MLSQYTLTFQTECPTPRQEWAYPLYASLLERLPASVGIRQHDGERTGVSQFVRCVGDGRLVWQVSLLGEEAEEIFAPILEEMDCCTLRREHATLRLRQRRVLRISAVEELLSRPYPARRQLRFVTPTAFKSRKAYDVLPTPERIMQSLIRRWNVCIPQCPIEDEDGEGTAMLARDLRCCGLQLRDCGYSLKGQVIPGTVGTMTLENRHSGFTAQLAHGLLTFAAFSGVGIKTTLGMGGVLE